MIFYMIFLAALAFVLIFLGIRNGGETVTVVGFTETYPNLSQPLVLLVTFLLGMATWMIVSVVQFFGAKGELRRLRKENRRLRDELTRVRNAPIQDLDEPGDVLDDSSAVARDFADSDAVR